MNKRAVGTNERGFVVGQDHHRSKLTDHEVDLIIRLREEGLKLIEIAEKFEISKTEVCYICKGERRSQIIIGQKFTRTSVRTAQWAGGNPSRKKQADESSQ